MNSREHINEVEIRETIDKLEADIEKIEKEREEYNQLKDAEIEKISLVISTLLNKLYVKKEVNKKKEFNYKKVMWYCFIVIILLLIVAWIADKYEIEKFADVVRIEEITVEGRGIYQGIVIKKNNVKYSKILDIKTGMILYSNPYPVCNTDNKPIKFKYVYEEMILFNNYKRPSRFKVINHKCNY